MHLIFPSFQKNIFQEKKAKFRLKKAVNLTAADAKTGSCLVY